MLKLAAMVLVQYDIESGETELLKINFKILIFGIGVGASVSIYIMDFFSARYVLGFTNIETMKILLMQKHDLDQKAMYIRHQ